MVYKLNTTPENKNKKQNKKTADWFELADAAGSRAI